MDYEDAIPMTLPELIGLLEDIDKYPHDTATRKNNCGSAESIQPVTTDGGNTKTHKNMNVGPPPKRIRKVGSVPYSTDLQRHRKTELLSLRSEAQELEDILSQLQQDGAKRSPLSQLGQEKWRNVSIIARKECYCAERTNQELKSKLLMHVTVLTAIRKVLWRSDDVEGIEALFQTQARPTQSLVQTNKANSALAEITNSLEWMLLRAESVFPALENCITVALKTYKIDCGFCGEVRDDCIETISVTPMPCTVSKSGMLLWQQLVGRKNSEPDKLYRFIRATQKTFLEMSFTLPLRDENSELLFVDAVSGYRKYEEKNRFVLVGKTTWILRGGGLELETLHWTVISPVDILQTSIVQSCNRLQLKSVDSTSVDGILVRDILLDSISKKLRSFMKTIQNELLRSVKALNPDLVDATRM